MKSNKKRFAIFAFALSVSMASSYAYALQVACGSHDGKDFCCLFWGPEFQNQIECSYV